MAQTLACLRIAGPVTGPSQGSLPACLAVALAGRGSHPLDDTSAFLGVPHPPFLADQPFLVALRLCVQISEDIDHHPRPQ